MNDNFLHRLRQPPRPEFLAELKSRLDRQPSRAARRPGFVVGLFVGLLAAGAAFALYLHASRHPTDADASQVKATPLAPAWLPTHPHVGPVEPAPSSASAVGSPEQQPAASDATATQTQTSWTFTFVATQQSLLSDLLSTSKVAGVRLKSPHYSLRDSLQHLCDGTGAYDFPDMVQLNRRLTVEEYRTCTHNGPSAIVEQKLGYQAVMLARSSDSGALRLTARDVFLALAQRVPNPEKPGELIDNPYTNWSQVDPTLPNDRIKFIGPYPESIPGGLLPALLLTAGCNTYPWITALRDNDEIRYSEICQRLRTDRVYQGSDDGSMLYRILDEPTAIGIYGGNAGFPRIGKGLAINPVDGIEPAMNTLASGAYPLARTLYLYLDKKRVSPGVETLVLSLLRDFTPHTATYWGFVPLDIPEQEALRNAEGDRFKELHF
jgi:phosphate transport system substrate-binding protein